MVKPSAPPSVAELVDAVSRLAEYARAQGFRQVDGSLTAVLASIHGWPAGAVEAECRLAFSRAGDGPSE